MSRPNPVQNVGLIPVVDTGYTKICPKCAARSGANSASKGKDRAIEITPCDPPCRTELKDARSHRRY
jgi:hypothetical protein